jgi:hypothetical protein
MVLDEHSQSVVALEAPANVSGLGDLDCDAGLLSGQTPD